jgi:hypothetical protein
MKRSRRLGSGVQQTADVEAVSLGQFPAGNLARTDRHSIARAPLRVAAQTAIYAAVTLVHSRTALRALPTGINACKPSLSDFVINVPMSMLSSFKTNVHVIMYMKI